MERPWHFPRARLSSALAARARQQAAVARLGQRALAGTEIATLAAEAVALVAETLGVEYCGLLEVSADAQRLLVRAGVGIPAGAAGWVAISLAEDSHARRVIETGRPLITQDEVHDRSCPVARALGLHGMRGGISVPVEGQGRPWGVLGAYSPRARRYSEDDANFVHAIAHVLATAIARQRLEAQLLQAEKVASMGQLLAGVAHEMNNPLAVVLGQADVLRRELGDGPHAERAEKIVRAADRCARIVRNFLALARSQPPERQPVSLNQIVHEAVELLAYGLRVDAVDVTLELSEDLPALTADPNQLHQVLVNLISNAHQALRRQGPPRTLRLETRYDPERAEVRLVAADDGPGIPEDVLPHIFEPFFTTKPRGEGTGLGLSLCRSVIETHGGSLTVRSLPGQGATFTVALPVAGGLARASAQVAAPQEQPAAPEGQKAVLVVDDEADVSGLLAEILSAEGYSVDAAPSGLVALEKIGQRSYDLILSDMRMPGLDGPGLYRELERRHPALCRRMIFLTGDALAAETRQFLDGLAVPTLTKPFSVRDVLAAVRRALSAG